MYTELLHRWSVDVLELATRNWCHCLTVVTAVCVLLQPVRTSHQERKDSVSGHHRMNVGCQRTRVRQNCLFDVRVDVHVDGVVLLQLIRSFRLQLNNTGTRWNRQVIKYQTNNVTIETTTCNSYIIQGVLAIVLNDLHIQ